MKNKSINSKGNIDELVKKNIKKNIYKVFFELVHTVLGFERYHYAGVRDIYMYDSRHEL